MNLCPICNKDHPPPEPMRFRSCYVQLYGVPGKRSKPSRTPISLTPKTITSVSVCPELGNPLRADQLLARGFDTTECGCTGKIRSCAIHDVCTTGEVKPGIACCKTCKDHPDRSGRESESEGE